MPRRPASRRANGEASRASMTSSRRTAHLDLLLASPLTPLGLRLRPGERWLSRRVEAEPESYSMVIALPMPRFAQDSLCLLAAAWSGRDSTAASTGGFNGCSLELKAAWVRKRSTASAARLASSGSVTTPSSRSSTR